MIPSRWKSFLPREHGAWAMLLLSLATGWGVRGTFDLPGALLTVGLVVLFVAQEAFSRSVSATSLGIAATGFVLCAVGAWNDGSNGMIASAVAGVLGATALLLRQEERNSGKVRLLAWKAHLVAAVAMASPVAILGVASDATTSILACFLTACGFVAGVLVVRARRGGGSEASLLWPMVAFVVVASFGNLSSLAWMAALALPGRWVLWRVRPSLSWRAVGWSEVAFCAWTAGLVVLSTVGIPPAILRGS